MRKIAFLVLILLTATVSMAAVSSFYIVNDTTGQKIPFGTGGELHFDNISGMPNAVTVFSSGGDMSAHTSDGTIHFTESSIDHTAIQSIGLTSHADIDTFIGTTYSNLSTLDAHAADSTIHFTASSLTHDALTGAAGYSNHSAIDAFLTENADTAADLSTHTGDSSIHFAASSLTHDALTGAAGYSNHSAIDTHLNDTAIHAPIWDNISTTTSSLWSSDYTKDYVDTEISGVSGGGSTVPPGVLWQYAGSTAPDGWLIANGACVSRATYSALFAVTSTTYGVCDGSTTFGLPDMRGRTAIGAGQGSGLTNRTLGNTVGVEAHALSSAQNGAHTHVERYINGAGSFSAMGIYTNGGAANAGADNAAGNTTASSGSGAAHNTMQPSLVVNFIIKY